MAQHDSRTPPPMPKRPPSAALLILASFALTASVIVGVRHAPPSLAATRLR